MSAPIKQNSFAGGEISPAMYARTDQTKYETGLRSMRNFIAMRQGGATNRPGTMFVDSALNGGEAVRFIPFIFNETGVGQSYVLEFGNLYVAFIQDGARIMDGSSPYTIVSPYAQADLSSLQFIQSADIITIVHPNYVPTELQRSGQTDWQFVPIQIGSRVSAPTAVGASGGNAALPKQFYSVSAISRTTGEESIVTAQLVLSAGGADVNNGVTVSWSSVDGAASYRIYKTNGPTSDVFGYIATGTGNSYVDYGIIPDFSNSPPIYFNPFTRPNSPQVVSTNFTLVSGQSYTYAWAITATIGGIEGAPTYLYSNIASLGVFTAIFSFSDITGSTYSIYRNDGVGGSVFGLQFSGLTYANASPYPDNGTVAPDFGTNPPPSISPLNPSVVGFSQQRRYFGATTLNPIGFWGSQTGNYYNFNTHSNPIDSDSIVGSLAGSEVNSIQHILELKFMLMLTAGAEIYLQGNGSGVVTPSAINASAQSQYGANELRPLRIADTFIFNQALGNSIRDLRFDFVINGYNGNELTIFSSHLFEGYQIVDWDFQKIPDSIVWVIRDDGVLLGLTYLREQQMLAWHRHDFENGFVENVCCIPENGNYAVYLCIKRVINDVTVRYVERMSSRIWSDVLNATYLDCFSSYNGTNTDTNLAMQLTSPTGTFDQTSSAYQQHLTLTSNSAFFTSDMIGDQIFLSDADFVLNKGNMVDPENDGSSFALSISGNQIRCTIISFDNATQVTVTPNKKVPTSFQNTGMTTWARAVKVVAGLDYLIGQDVSVWADRTLVASPKNSEVRFQATVDTDGSLTLDKHYAVIYVGLPITSDLETLDIENVAGETIIGKRKRQVQLGIHLLNTRTLFAGSENPDSNFDNTNDDPLFQLFELKTGINRQTYDQPPQLVTGQDVILEDTRYNKNGRIFIRNVDPTPLTILAVSPGGDYFSQNQAIRV